MSGDLPLDFPISEAARLDGEIKKRMARVAAGDATENDKYEALQLARQRSQLHMPGMFRTHAAYRDPPEGPERDF